MTDTPISREQAVKAFADYCDGLKDRPLAHAMYGDFVKLISALPPLNSLREPREELEELRVEVRRLRGLAGIPAVECGKCGNPVGFSFMAAKWVGRGFHADGWDNCHDGSTLLGTFAEAGDKRGWHWTDGSCCDGKCRAILASAPVEPCPTNHKALNIKCFWGMYSANSKIHAAKFCPDCGQPLSSPQGETHE